jgi:hypothetical protein
MTKAAVIQAQQRWEYMSIARRSDSYLAKELNELGQSGWELVSVNQAKDLKGELAWVAFLKRPATHSSVSTAQPAAASSEQPAAASSEQPVEEAQPTAPPETAAPAAPQAERGFDLSGDEFKIAEE